jgi:hypothetical protein
VASVMKSDAGAFSIAVPNARKGTRTKTS